MRHNVSMTHLDSETAAHRGTPDLRADVRLIGLHRERGDAHSRLESALAALEGAEWGLTLAGEAALARQLRRVLGAGVLRVDPRLPVRRDLLAEAGLAAAGLEGDWQGAVAVWLLEPSEDDLRRAGQAGVPVIVDATLAPGAAWLDAGAQYVTYHHGAALTGFAEGELALLFGAGGRPEPAAPAAADLTAALALRDVATLPLRLARAAQTAAQLAAQLSGRALPLGPTALLLPPEAAAATAAPLGGVLPAARPVQGGVILTPGLAETRRVRALLRSENRHSDSGHSDAPAHTGGHSTTVPQAAMPQTAVSQTAGDQAAGIQANDHRSAKPHLARGHEGHSQHDAPVADQAVTPVTETQATESQATGTRAPREAHTSGSRTPREQEQRRADRYADRTWQGQGGRSPQRPERAGASGSANAGRDSGLERFVFEAPAGPAEQSAPGHAQPAEQRPPAPEAGPQGAELGGSSSPASAPSEPLQPEPSQAELLAPDLPPAAQPGGAKPDPTADLTEEQSAVFARLRDWRNAEASRQEISRFIVASNATLAEIARRVPYTVEDLQAIKGMGPARLSKYGEAIVQVVRGTRR